eukprot:s324_g14.t1
MMALSKLLVISTLASVLAWEECYAVPKGDALGPNGAAAGDPWTQGPWALVQHRDVLHKCFRECAAGVYDLTYYASSPSQLSVTQPVERKYCSNESLSAAAEIQEVECTSSVFKCSKQMGTASNACSGKFQLTEAYDGNQTTQLTWFMALSFFISQPARGKTESVIQASFVLLSGTEYVGWYTIDESKCTGVGFWGPSFLVSAGEVEDPPDPPIIPEMQKLGLQFPKVRAARDHGSSGDGFPDWATVAVIALVTLAICVALCMRRARKIREAEEIELHGAVMSSTPRDPHLPPRYARSANQQPSENRDAGMPAVQKQDEDTLRMPKAIGPHAGQSQPGRSVSKQPQGACCEVDGARGGPLGPKQTGKA